MRRFMKTIVPTEGYEQVKKQGDIYVVHLEGNTTEVGTECWECITPEEPNLNTLQTELNEYKVYLAERELAQAKAQKIKQLLVYDTSDAVNSFELRRGGVKVTDYWLPRDLRTSLEGDVIAAEAVGETYKFDIREMGISLTLNCTKFLEALAHLRQYAYTAYNVTSAHMAAIDNLNTVSAVEEYDFTEDYPEKLVFNLEDLT